MDPLLLAAGWIFLVSLVDLVLCVADKSQARSGGRRVRERTLLLLALLGGSPGLLVGMFVSRHKTRKPSFLAALMGILALQGAVAAGILMTT